MLGGHQIISPDDFDSFGPLLRYLRQRAQLTLRNLAIAVGYSEGHLSRLERGAPPPEAAILRARFVPVLAPTAPPVWISRLLALAEASHGSSDGDPSDLFATLASQTIADTGLLHTKLTPPLMVAELVARPHLIAQIESGQRVPLTVLTAPAGAGKTSLLASFTLRASAKGLRIAWVSLDPADNDGTLFLRYLIAALRTHTPEVGTTTLALLQNSHMLPSLVLLTPLLNDLAALNNEHVLILDDYHNITSPTIHEMVATVVGRIPEHLHVIIASRETPLLPLALLRARRHLVEIQPEALRFTTSEAAQLIQLVMGVGVSYNYAQALVDRTEGWVTGLLLASLALRAQPDRLTAITEFGGTHRYIADYLTSEVLDVLPEHLRRFLLWTSLLRRLCGPLCDALLVNVGTEAGQQPGQRMLEELERRHLFLLPLDDQRHWYRYHQLFAELLVVQLQQSVDGATITALHCRARDWYDQADMVDEAIWHALAAGATDSAVQIIERRAANYLANGMMVPLIRWLAQIPEEHARISQPLSFAHAMIAVANGELEPAEEWLSVAEGLHLHTAGVPQEEPAQEQWITHPAALMLMRADIARAQLKPPEALALSQQVWDNLPPQLSFLRTWAQWEMAIAYMNLGDLSTARQLFLALLADRSVHSGPFLLSLIYLGRIALINGRLREAEEMYARILQTSDRHSQYGRVLGLLELGMGIIQYQQNNLSGALQCAKSALELGAEPPNPLLLILGHVLQARVYQAQCDHNGAHVALDEAEALLPGLRQPFFTELLLMGAARTWLAQGRGEIVRSWTAMFCGEPGTPHADVEHLTMAQLLLHESRSAEAIEILQMLTDAQQPTNRAGIVMEALVLLVRAYLTHGDTVHAQLALERVLVMAEPEGFVRLFADEGQPVAKLLETLRPTSSMSQYVDRLLASFPPHE